MESSDIYETDLLQQLQKDISQLKDKLQRQEDLLKGVTPWEGSELYKEVDSLQLKRQERQAQYKQLMKDRYQFVISRTAIQQAGEAFLEDKLNKAIRGLTHEIQTLLESRTSKSSISSCSFDKVESMDWVLQERQEQHIKEQDKIYMEIKELQKILEELQ